MPVQLLGKSTFCGYCGRMDNLRRPARQFDRQTALAINLDNEIRWQGACIGVDMTRTANIDSQSLRGFLRMVESDYPDEFLRIGHEIDPKFESTAMLFELDRAGRSPVVVFEN